MCGIYLTTKRLNESEKQSITASLFHRGPDEQHWSESSAIQILHTRLSIVGVTDPDAVQPWRTESGDITAFNGELFNYKQFGPTEVKALVSIVSRRLSPLSMLNGYYAAVHYDTGREEIRAYRDPFGVMPLWYKREGTALELCSEAQGKGWKQVPACSELRFSLKSKRLKIIKTPLSALFPVESPSGDLDEIFLGAVARVVNHSEVGYDLALSGGLDSSLLLMGIVIQGLPLPKRIHTVYYGSDSDELVRAKGLVKDLGLEHLHVIHELPPMDLKVVRKFLPTPNPIKDFAFWRHYNVAQHSLSRVLLCGEGADEIALGYPSDRDYADPVTQYWRRISLLRSQQVMTLDRVNLAGMAHSVEYRVPFLDHLFVRAMLGTSLGDGRGKKPLVALGKNLGLPRQILEASKFGTEEHTYRK